MKITSWFTHPQAIVGVYDFLLSDKYNQSYKKTRYICYMKKKMHCWSVPSSVQAWISRRRTFVSCSVWKQHSRAIRLAFSLRAQCGKALNSSKNMLVLREPSFVHSNRNLDYRIFLSKSSFCTSNLWLVFCFALSSVLLC